MNHFRDLLKAIDQDTLGFPKGACDEVCKSVNVLTKQCAIDIQCFYLGDRCQFLEIETIDECLRLPFDTCWFECYQNYNNYNRILGILCTKINDKEICVMLFNRELTKWTFNIGLNLNNGFNPHSEMMATNKTSLSGFDTTDATIDFLCGGIKSFLTVINCTNVKRNKIDPPEKLQKAALRNGNRPLFSYWTLSIGGEPMTGGNNGRGGSHQQPRHHIRRGHARQYAPGKYTWVSPCMVGNKELGTIRKDYSVKVAT